jgi:gamma-glutamyltranspeptidase
MIDHGKDMAQALTTPRIAFVAETRTLTVEPRLPETIRKSLEARGHAVHVADIGRLQGLTVEWGAEGKPRRFTGAADPRGVGAARGGD